jgi:flagellar P-ring protein precursor FlgI
MALAMPAAAARVKDLASIDGVRDNQLIGFGLVGGLAGTGDDPKSAPYTAEAIANMMASFGFEVEPLTIKVKNFAAVMVTCDMPAYVSSGDRLDVQISSVGSAKSLEGGQLYQTLLRGADDRVYAVAQGAVSLGRTIGDDGGGGGRGGLKTIGRVPQGALVESTIPSTLIKEDGGLHLNLHTPDFTTAAALAEAVNVAFGRDSSRALDAGTVGVVIPVEFRANLVPFISVLENLEVEPDTVAKVVINQRTGTVVMGQHVTIMPVAVAHGSMTLTFGETIESPGTADEETPEAAPSGAPPIGGEATPAEASPEEELELLRLPTTAEKVALGLGKMNLAPADIVAIFEAIAAAGALLGELEVI